MSLFTTGISIVSKFGRLTAASGVLLMALVCSNTALSSSLASTRHEHAVAHTSAAPQNPCGFVSRSEIAAIFHAKVRSETDAPLGPTCIIELKGDPHNVTITVEVINVSRETAQMKSRPKEIKIRGHASYCGVLGTPLLLVKLSGGRALVISAPCAAAEALAAKALPHVKA